MEESSSLKSQGNRGVCFSQKGRKGRSRSLTVGCTCQMAFGHLADCPSSPPNTTNVEASVLRLPYRVPGTASLMHDGSSSLGAGNSASSRPAAALRLASDGCFAFLYCDRLLPCLRARNLRNDHLMATADISQVQSSQKQAHEEPKSRGTSSKVPTLRYIINQAATSCNKTLRAWTQVALDTQPGSARSLVGTWGTSTQFVLTSTALPETGRPVWERINRISTRFWPIVPTSSPPAPQIRLFRGKFRP